MQTQEVNQSPLSATAPAFVPSDQSKSNRTNATDGDVNGGDIVPVPWTTIFCDRLNSSNADGRDNNLSHPLPALRKAKLYSSGSGSGGVSGGLDGFGAVVDGSNIDDDEEENASPVPPSTKKSRPNNTTSSIGTTKVTLTGGGLSPMTSSMQAFIAAATITTTTTTTTTPGSTSKKKRAGEKRVTISDDGNGNGIGYINGVAIGSVSGSSGNTGVGPGSKCFDVVDLNTKKKSPSLGKYKKTPGPYKSAIALLDALDLSSPEKSPSSAPHLSKKSSYPSFRRTPGAGRKKNSSAASASTSINLSRKRLLSTLSVANDDSAGSGVSIGGGDDEEGGGDSVHTPAERAKSRSLAKAALSATKAKLLQKAKDSGEIDASCDGGHPIPIILSAQSANGNYLGSHITIALDGKLQSVTIDGLGDKMGTYRASNKSGLCLHLDRAPIDRILLGSASPLAYQSPLSKTLITVNDSTADIDGGGDDGKDSDTSTVGTIGTIGTVKDQHSWRDREDDDTATVGEHSWRQDISRSPLRAYCITSSDEKKLLSEPLRSDSNTVYDDNSLIMWTKDDSTVAYEMPQEDLFDSDYEYKGLEEEEEEESKKGGDEDDGYFADMGTGLTDTSHGGNASSSNLSEFMPNDVQQGKTDNVVKDPDSSATLGVSNCTSRGGETVLPSFRHDEDEASDDGDAAAATILLSEGDGGSASGNGTIDTAGTSRKATTSIVSSRRDDSTLHMHSFLAGMATLFLAQVGMAFLGFLFFFILTKTVTE